MSAKTQDTDAHARLSCSAAYRWTVCPGAPRLEAQFPDETSPYAAEGTRAHTLLETACLLGLETTAEAVTLVEGADAEMAEQLQPMLDWIKQEQASRPGAVLFFERKLNPGRALGRDDLWGTGDLVILDEPRKEVLIGDLKYGAGLAVEAVNNQQLRLYGLGAVALATFPVEHIVTVILQPRAYHTDGPIRTETIARADLDAFAQEIAAAAAATDADDAPLVAGEHCHFCRAAGGCSVLAEHAMSIAREAFRAVEQPLDPQRIARLLREVDVVRGWLKALEEYALRIAKDGTELPGFKLAKRRGHRKWINPETALIELAAAYSVTDDQIAPRTLISPAQAEKVIKAAVGHKADLSELVHTPELGPRLVPDKAQGEDVFAEVIDLFAGLEDAA